MTSRRKSIGRGDEASGPVMSASASESMARGERLEKGRHREHGKPQNDGYSRELDGEYGASVHNPQ